MCKHGIECKMSENCHSTCRLFPAVSDGSYDGDDTETKMQKTMMLTTMMWFADDEYEGFDE